MKSYVAARTTISREVNTIVETNIDTYHAHKLNVERAIHASVVLVTLRLHTARPFQMVESAKKRVNVTKTTASEKQTALK